jgi:hypothetical protein
VEGVDVLAHVVRRERRAHGALHAEATEDRLGAVVAGADGDAFLVERRAELLGALAVDDEGEQKTKKSASSACTSLGAWDTDCAQSTSTRAPWRCAVATIACAGVMVPSAFETCGSATSFVRGPRSFSYSGRMPSVAPRTNTIPARRGLHAERAGAGRKYGVASGAAPAAEST